MITTLLEASAATQTAAYVLNAGLLVGRWSELNLRCVAKWSCEHRLAHVRARKRTARAMAELELERRHALETP